MKILFLLPPSEAKNSWWNQDKEKLEYLFKKPCDISKNVSENDLKCKWKRFEEWLELNKHLCENKQEEFMFSIERYTWVMYNYIDYTSMIDEEKQFFENNFLICSWMYGLLKSKDSIWNYKLPIETKWLYKYWWTRVVEIINDMEVDYVVNLLPISYSKLIFWNNKTEEKNFDKFRKFWIININFLKEDWKKISHWVKRIKWEWIKKICKNNITNYNEFWWEISKKWNWIIDINLLINNLKNEKNNSFYNKLFNS